MLKGDRDQDGGISRDCGKLSAGLGVDISEYLSRPAIVEASKADREAARAEGDLGKLGWPAVRKALAAHARSVQFFGSAK
jgi:hypothetical protein